MKWLYKALEWETSWLPDGQLLDNIEDDGFSEKKASYTRLLVSKTIPRNQSGCAHKLYNISVVVQLYPWI